MCFSNNFCNNYTLSKGNANRSPPPNSAALNKHFIPIDASWKVSRTPFHHYCKHVLSNANECQ